MTELRDKGGVLVDSFLRRSGRQGADFSYCLYAVASVAGSRGRATAVATFAHSGQGDKVMHKFASIAASSAGALFTILVAVPKVDAMAFNNTAGAPVFGRLRLRREARTRPKVPRARLPKSPL
jgi:hypothetical protein